MLEKIKKFIPLILITLIPTILVWLPFYLRFGTFWNIPLPPNGMATIVANFDGPLYITIAKTFYNVEALRGFQFPLPIEYYAAHFPLFPLLIRLFGMVIGFPYGMLIATILSSFLAIYFFYKLINTYLDGKDALFLTFLFSIFPARFLIVRSVGSAEPLFMAAIIASLYFFRKEKYLWAGIWGMVAQLTKSPGVLLFISYVLLIFIPKLKELPTMGVISWIKSLNLKRYLPLLLIPLGLLLIFGVYSVQYKDFFAYFHSGDNIHLFFPPFQIFNYSAPWVGTFWLEEIIFIYFLGILGIINLIRQKETVFAWFCGVFFATLIFVSHRDLMRYALPIVPFIFFAFKDTLVKKDLRIPLIILSIPIYLFTLAYISQNVMPVSNWLPLL